MECMFITCVTSYPSPSDLSNTCGPIEGVYCTYLRYSYKGKFYCKSIQLALYDTPIPTSLKMTDLYSTNNTEVFVYTEGAAVPRDVVHVRVHPTVSEIPAEAFRGCIKLEEVELCEGLLDIKEDTFLGCRSLVNISIPNSNYMKDCNK